jgi:periplasmic divalent cation tolerance protein
MESSAIELILCTAPEGEAEVIARMIIEERHAACVNITPVRSVYRWDGEVVVDNEQLLICKTTADRRGDLIRRIGEVHSYDTPEVLALSILDGDDSYLAWVQSEVSR